MRDIETRTSTVAEGSNPPARPLSSGLVRIETLQSITYPAVLWLVQLLVSLIVVYIFTHVVRSGPSVVSDSWFSNVANWDGQWFVLIAKNGYTTPISAAFFPGFPLLIRAVHFVVPISYPAIGFLISNLCGFLAVSILYKLIMTTSGPALARRSVWLLLMYPASMFLNMVYTESLSLLAVVLFFYFIQKNEWWAAMLSGFAATIVHDLGVVLVFPALIYWWKHLRSWKHLLGITIIPLSLVMYMAYLYIKFGDAFQFVAAQSHWGRIPVLPVVSIFSAMGSINLGAHQFAGNLSFMMLVNGLFTLLFVVVALWSKLDRTISTEMKAFFYITLLASISSGTGLNSHSIIIATSYARLILILFPAYITLAKWLRNEYALMSVSMFMFALKVILIGMFADGYWIV